MKFIIEHIEPELYKWCIIEYEYISKIIGKRNLIFTNIKNKDIAKLRKLGDACEKSVSELKLKNICVLSQYSKKQLDSNDKNKFRYFIFGGILGDNPARKRTNELISRLKKYSIKFETRSLGSKQMPTDTAVYVAKKILRGEQLEDMDFVDCINVKIKENESIMLPYRYVIENNKPVLNIKLINYLKRKKGF